MNIGLIITWLVWITYMVILAVRKSSFISVIIFPILISFFIWQAGKFSDKAALITSLAVNGSFIIITAIAVMREKKEKKHKNLNGK